MAIVRSQYFSARVHANHALTSRLFALQLEVEQQPFLAGQFVRLQLPVDGESVAKSYSLVNAPGSDMAEVFFNQVPGGRLSTALAALKAGDIVEISQPANGFFVLDEVPDCDVLWLFATGTGLGPYLSMLQQGDIFERFAKVVLIHGVPSNEELVYQHIIQAALTQYPRQFQYISCVSREKNTQGGFDGRVTQAVSSNVLEERTGLTISIDSHVMLCGNHQMIDDMMSLLAERGMKKHRRRTPGHITTEQYF